MILWTTLFLLFIFAIFVLVLIWKNTVVRTLDENPESPEVYFYDDEPSGNVPFYISPIEKKCLDSRVSGAVRYNQSLYYDQKEFEKIKVDVLNKKFPI